MRQFCLKFLVIALCTCCCWCVAAGQARKSAEVSLRSASIRVLNQGGEQPPRFVLRSLEDLRGQIGGTIISASANKKAEPAPAVEVSLDTNSDTNDLGEEGFIVAASRDKVTIRARAWRGIHYGVLELVRRLAESPSGAGLPTTLTLRERPSFDLRAMYAHTAWVYRHPFALRRWNVDDWKRYVDLLAYLKVNVLQIWNLVSIVPQPPSAPDKAYLEMFADVVRYAREERGFRAVWVGDAANNVALPNTTPIADREYYVVHSLKNPSDPAQLTEVVLSRRSLYEAIPDADGYWIIDSDPGGWPGSSSQDFVKILAANRQIIDGVTRRKAGSELIYWIWQGWGTQTKTEDLAIVLDALRQGAAGRFRLLACFPNDLKLVSKYGLSDQTVWFPYGAIEGEPSSPYTALRFPEIRQAFVPALDESHPQLPGVMGNAQTPLAQIPNLWFFQRSAWEQSYRNKTESLAILREIASDVFPAIADELAVGWLLLASDDSRAVREASQKLEKDVAGKRLGQPGTIGRYLTPDGQWLVSNLARQLKVHAAANELTDALRTKPETSADKIKDAAAQYFELAAAMVEETGFRAALDKKGANLLPFFNWYYPNGDYAKIRAAWKAYKETRPQAAQRIRADMMQNFAGSGKPIFHQEMIEFLVGEPPQRDPNFKYAN